MANPLLYNKPKFLAIALCMYVCKFIASNNTECTII